MRNSTAAEPVRLITPWALLLIVALLGALIVLTYTGEDVFMPGEKQPDAVSVSYAELLLKAHPEDTGLRLKLIDQLIALGDIQRARSHVFQLGKDEAGAVRVYLAELAVLEALVEPDGLSEQGRDELRGRLRAVPRDSLSNEQLVRFARYALAITDPGLAAQAYRDLARREPANSTSWLDSAARAHLGAGQVPEAAELFSELLRRAETPADQRRYLGDAFAALVAADRSEQAAELVYRHLSRLNASDSSLFLATVQAGVRSHRYDLANETVSAWRRVLPDDETALAAEFRLRMAAGELEPAWQLGERLATAQPNDAELLEQVAKLGEWAGHTSAALGLWLRLIQLQDAPETREHAWRLAAQLYDFDSTIDLLSGMGSHRQLSDVELDALVYSHSERGTPEQAERWLRRYVHLHPAHKLAWMRLQQLLQQTQQLDAQVALWAELERRFGLSIAQRLEWAEAEWQRFEPQAAWQVLERIDKGSVTDQPFWRLRAELAWELERDTEALESYSRLIVLGVSPDTTAEERLIALYERSAPSKALDVMVASWQRNRTAPHLARALQLAMNLGDLTRLDALVREGRELPDSDRISELWSARALQASHAGNWEEAERLYRDAMARFPQSDEFLPQLIWHFIDNGQRESLGVLLRQWRRLAAKRSALWLPFASANVMLNRSQEALRWFDLYLQVNADDSLVQAAYADALDGAGYTDRALRLRRHLLRSTGAPSHGADVAQYETYLRLLRAIGANPTSRTVALQWHNGARPMLQLWFDQYSEQLDALGQASLKGQWLAWARRNGLKISKYADLQDALLADNRQALVGLLASPGLDPAQRVEVLQRLGYTSQAMAESLAALSPEQPVDTRQQLLRQALSLQERNPQGLQIGMRQQDFGSLRLRGYTAQAARQLDRDWHATLSLARLDYSGAGFPGARPGVERVAGLEAFRTLGNGSLGAAVDASDNEAGRRFGLGLSRTLQLSSTDTVKFRADWRRQAEESGLLRAFGRRDGLGISGSHGISARDQVTWSLSQQRYSTLSGEQVGSGRQANLELNHAIFFEGPSWTLRSGLDYAKYGVEGDDLLSVGAPPADVLQERFGQVYLGSTWRRGLLGSLNPGAAQYTWLLDGLVGWQWTERQFNYSVTAGVGMQVLGDDELAFTFGFQSAPRGGDGEPGGTLGVTYGVRFGR